LEERVSRVLFPPGRAGPDHSSRPDVTAGLERPTRELQAGNPQTLPYLALLRVGFTELPVSPPGLVSSYLTVSPLPSTQPVECSAVCFLWHFPARRRDWVLPSTLPCGARTFLPSRPGARPAIGYAPPNPL